MLSLLERRNAYSQHSRLSASHIQLDTLSRHVSEQLFEWKNLTAMTCGGLAYQAGKWASFSLGARKLAPLIGLATEVSVFRGTASLLHAPTPPSSWISDYVHFGALRTLGLATRSSPVLLSHFIQDAGTLAAQHLTFAFHLTSAPQGSLLEQLIYAEITNLQIAAGMRFIHLGSQGKILIFEKGLELSIKAKERHALIRSYRLSPVKEASALFASRTDIAAYYPRMLALQQDYLGCLRSEDAILFEARIPLSKFVHDLDSSPRWLKHYAELHPDLEIQQINLNPEQLAEIKFQNLYFLASMLSDIEKNWSLPISSLSLQFRDPSNSEARLRLYLPPAALLMDSRFLIPGRSPIALDIQTRLSSHPEVVDMMAVDTRPFLIGDRPNSLHQFSNVHPYIQMVHDYLHLMIMDKLRPEERRQLFNVYQSLRRIDPDLLKANLNEEIPGRILEGTFMGVQQDLFFSLFKMVQLHNPSIAFLKAWHTELEKSFPENHRKRREVFLAFEQTFGKSWKSGN